MDFNEDLGLEVYEDEVLDTYRAEQKAAMEIPCVVLSNILSFRTAKYITEHFRGNTPLYVSVGEDIARIGGIDFTLDNVLKLRVLSEDMMVSYLSTDGGRHDYNLKDPEALESIAFSRG